MPPTLGADFCTFLVAFWALAAFFWAAEAADAAGFFVVVFVVFFVSLAALQEKTGDADEIRARVCRRL